MPRYILFNSSNFALQYRQQGTTLEKELKSKQSSSIHWTDSNLPLRLNIRIQEAGWLWSGGLSLESPGDMFVKIRHRQKEETMLFSVNIDINKNGILLCLLTHQMSGFAPYRLDNFTSEKLHVRQELCREQEDILRPYSCISYAWDEPNGPHKILLEMAGHQLIGTVNLDLIGHYSSVVLPPDHNSPFNTGRFNLYKLHFVII